MKYGIKVLVGSQVGSEFRVFSKPVHHFQLCALSIDGPLAQMSTEEFESAMSENRPQVLICSVEFLTSKKVGLGAFPIVNGHLSLRVSGQRCDLLQPSCSWRAEAPCLHRRGTSKA